MEKKRQPPATLTNRGICRLQPTTADHEVRPEGPRPGKAMIKIVSSTMTGLTGKEATPVLTPIYHTSLQRKAKHLRTPQRTALCSPIPGKDKEPVQCWYWLLESPRAGGVLQMACAAKLTRRHWVPRCRRVNSWTSIPGR
ncbi:Hypothetical predicted protein [Pelobates cultripes]|uniref:Uncharacterized protein n=1 Tax=Pelobates cultripes TaxID=61616 RepID=A0AAD1W233_PELCU|nr:Hypothetical predicted protein [Pelobates cultripes]